MALCDTNSSGWQERARRFRRLSTLLHKQDGNALLRLLATEIEWLSTIGWDVTTAIEELADVYLRVLVVEIDEVVALANGQRSLRSAPHYSADDLREVSRLFVEEARATAQTAMSGLLTLRALELTLTAEQVARGQVEHFAKPNTPSHTCERGPVQALVVRGTRPESHLFGDPTESNRADHDPQV